MLTNFDEGGCLVTGVTVLASPIIYDGTFGLLLCRSGDTPFALVAARTPLVTFMALSFDMYYYKLDSATYSYPIVQVPVFL